MSFFNKIVFQVTDVANAAITDNLLAHVPHCIVD